VRGPKRKRLLQDVVSFGGVMAERQKAWLRRSDDDIARQAWRLDIFHRQGARRWIWHLDNIIRQTTSLGGVWYLHYSLLQDEWK